MFSQGVLVVGVLSLFAGACRSSFAEPGTAPPSPVAAKPPTRPSQPSPICRPDAAKPLPVEPGRSRHCVIDVGSRNVKLIVASLTGKERLSFKNDRQCRARLQLGEKTFDSATKTGRPLSLGDQTDLVKVLNEYRALCDSDGGQLAGALATEWARRATNPDDIRSALTERTSLDLDIIAPEQEARYGYLAATRGVPGKLVVDFGSRSVQLSFWSRGASRHEGQSIPMGIDEAGDRFFDRPEFKDYAAAKAAFLQAIRPQLAPLLARARLALKKGTLGPELFSLGENGDLALALDGRLWDAQAHRGLDEAGYGALIKGFSPRKNPKYGLVTAVASTRDFAALGRALSKSPALFEELRSDRIKRIYGNKMLAFPALIELVAKEVGVHTVVLVPQEMADGFIVEKITGAPK